MNEHETRQALEDALVKIRKVEGLRSDGVAQLLEEILNFPNGPISIRASGASGAQPPKYFSDLTFQEFMQGCWSAEDPRPMPEVILEKLKGVVELSEWAYLLKNNDLLDN